MPASTRDMIFDLFTAVASVAAVFVVTMVLTMHSGVNVSSVYLVAVMYSSWRRGLFAGISATLLSAIVGVYFFLAPFYSFRLTGDSVIQIAVFIAAAVMITLLSRSRQNALRLERAARAEAENAVRIKDELVSGVSHELRTPLTTIKALARLLMREGIDQKKQREYLETISIECDRQIDLVMNLLDVSRIRGGVLHLALGKTNVRDVVNGCMRSAAIAAERRSHSLSVSVAEVLPPVCAEPKVLGRIVNNLIENAIKYTPEGGQIDVAAMPSADGVEISISDNGPGITPAEVPYLFDKFHQAFEHGARVPQRDREDAEFSGVGLGLYVAKNMIERMNGNISVESRPGVGSKFTLHLRAFDGSCGQEQTNG